MEVRVRETVKGRVHHCRHGLAVPPEIRCAADKSPASIARSAYFDELAVGAFQPVEQLGVWAF
jgi:hypothetical protein